MSYLNGTFRNDTSSGNLFEAYYHGTFVPQEPPPLPRTMRANYPQPHNGDEGKQFLDHFQSQVWDKLEEARKHRSQLQVELEIEPPKITVDVTSPTSLQFVVHIYVATPEIMLVEEQTRFEYLPDYVKEMHRTHLPIYEVGAQTWGAPVEYVRGALNYPERLDLLTYCSEGEAVRRLVQVQTTNNYAYICKSLTYRGEE